MPEATLFLDLDATELSAAEAELLQHPLIGGVILFARNTESAVQTAQLVAAIRSICPELVISLDQEGGRVQRLKSGVTCLPAVQTLEALYQQDVQAGLEAAADLGYLMAAELRELDIDLSFAPVLDVDYGRNSVIGDRAFAADVDRVCGLSAAYVQGMAAAGMAATGKHFPGHGWADADTHHAAAVDERSFDMLWQSDMVPFREAVAAGMQAMMLAHVLYPACDPEPAGFSEYWLQTILRQKIGFQGIIFSDDLSMKAAHSAGGYAQRAASAISAGCQALLCCNDRQGTLAVLEYLEQAGCTPLSGLNRLRGQAWQVAPARLTQARELAARLNNA